MQQWEQEAAANSIPVLPEEAAVPSVTAEKYDVDLDVTDVPETMGDIVADTGYDVVPMDTEDFNLVISKDLCLEDATSRLRAKRGEIDVYHDDNEDL